MKFIIITEDNATKIERAKKLANECATNSEVAAEDVVFDIINIEQIDRCGVNGKAASTDEAGKMISDIHEKIIASMIEGDDYTVIIIDVYDNVIMSYIVNITYVDLICGVDKRTIKFTHEHMVDIAMVYNDDTLVLMD